MFECLKRLFKKKKEKTPYIPLYRNTYQDTTREIIGEINLLRKNKLKECADRLVFDQSYGHSEWMYKNNIFSHENFGKRNAVITENTKYTAVGENLARNLKEPNKVVNAWYHSDTHRDIMLNETYSEVSIAICENFTTALFLKQ